MNEFYIAYNFLFIGEKREQGVSKNGRKKWSRKLNFELKGMHATCVTCHLSKLHSPCHLTP